MTEMIRTHVLLPKDLVARIDEQVGPRRRSEFVAETLRKELDRSHILKLALAARDEARRLGNKGGPPEWATSEGAAAWVRAQRQTVAGVADPIPSGHEKAG